MYVILILRARHRCFSIDLILVYNSFTLSLNVYILRSSFTRRTSRNHISTISKRFACALDSDILLQFYITTYWGTFYLMIYLLYYYREEPAWPVSKCTFKTQPVYAVQAGASIHRQSWGDTTFVELKFEPLSTQAPLRLAWARRSLMGPLYKHHYHDYGSPNGLVKYMCT